MVSQVPKPPPSLLIVAQLSRHLSDRCLFGVTICPFIYLSLCPNLFFNLILLSRTLLLTSLLHYTYTTLHLLSKTVSYRSLWSFLFIRDIKMVKKSNSYVAASYFDKDFPTKEVARMITQKVEEQLRQDHQQAIFGGPTPYNVVPSSSSIGSFHGPNPAPLLIVNFKCCRSEIFFVAEGAGLVLQEGDLVIVEADRGTDLGSVQHINVSWEAARKYKTLYAEQHFQWLMMFSNQSRIGAPNLFNPNAVVPGNGGVNLPGHGSRDGDIKPKLIKRLAQAHEIQALRTKKEMKLRLSESASRKFRTTA